MKLTELSDFRITVRKILAEHYGIKYLGFERDAWFEGVTFAVVSSGGQNAPTTTAFIIANAIQQGVQ